MPIYEYECEECCFRFELKRRFGEDGGAHCPQCRAEARRIFSPVAIIFKGSGFYVTDSRDNHRDASEEGKDSKAEVSKKSEGKDSKAEVSKKSEGKDSKAEVSKKSESK